MFIYKIHSNFQPAPGQKVLKAEEYLNYCKANELLDAAKAQAEQIIADGHQAYQQAEQRGYQIGLQRAKAELIEDMLANAKRAVNYLAELENSMVDTVMLAVKKILGSFDDIEKVRRIVAMLMRNIQQEAELTLRVPPNAVKLAQAVIAQNAAAANIQIVADAELVPDTFRMESPTAVVDLSLSEHLKILEQTLRQQF